MTRHVWTNEDIAAVRRGIIMEKSYAQIGAELGVSGNAVAQKMQRLGLGSHERSGFLRYRRCKGKQRPKSVAKRIAEANRAAMNDPARRAKHIAQCLRNAASPKRIKASLRAMDRKRGGPIPSEHAETMRFLRETKRLMSREAFAIVRTLPSTTLTTTGA